MSSARMKVGVECYAGYRADESPRRLHIGERLIHVVAVIDRWMTPDYRYFRVEGMTVALTCCVYTLIRGSGAALTEPGAIWEWLYRIKRAHFRFRLA
jgi:hypothetical protein